MTVSVTTEVIGLKELLKEINKVDRVARRAITKEVQPLGRAFAEAIASQMPAVVMHRGYRYKWRQRSKRGYRDILPFEPGEKLAKAKIKINTRGARARNRAVGAQYETLSVFAVHFQHPFLNVIEFAGKGKQSRTRDGWGRVSNNFINLLERDYGDAGRLIWDTIDSHPQVAEALQDGIKDTLLASLEKMGWDTNYWRRRL